MGRAVHKVIAETAKAMCDEAYEDRAKDNMFYRAYPTCRSYTRSNYKFFIRAAREVLARLLAQQCPVDESHEAWQDRQDMIFEALMADRALPQGNIGEVPTGLIH